MFGRMLGALVVLALTTSAGAASAFLTGPVSGSDRYIVVFEDGVDHPGTLARAQTEQAGGRLGFVYRHALNGYSAELGHQAVEGLRRDPRVKYVVADAPTDESAQEVPRGVSRIFELTNKTLDIDGVDDQTLKVDVAVIDTGVNAHEDLTIRGRTDCMNATELKTECEDGSGFDIQGHGTGVAGIVGAIDNGVGVVGTAPGARIWSVKTSDGIHESSASMRLAGIDWVTATQTDGDSTNDIEVANMSFACVNCASAPAFNEALAKMAAVGVVPVAGAGNGGIDMKTTSPANSPDAIAVSGIADYDGKPGGLGSPVCGFTDPDDTRGAAATSARGSTSPLPRPASTRRPIRALANTPI